MAAPCSALTKKCSQYSRNSRRKTPRPKSRLSKSSRDTLTQSMLVRRVSTNQWFQRISRTAKVSQTRSRIFWHSSSTISLTIYIVSIVNITGLVIEHTSMRVFTIVWPSTFICWTIYIYDLSLSIFYKTSMLSKVNITTHIKKFTNALANVLVEISFKNNTRRNE